MELQKNLVDLLGKRRQIIHLLLRRGPITRADIMAATGVSQPTVTQWLRELITAGIVREIGISQDGPTLGRPRVLLELNPAAAWVGAIHLTSVMGDVGLVNLKGEVVESYSIIYESLDMSYSQKLLEMLTAKFSEWIQEKNIPAERVLGLGVATSGPVDNERGTVASYSSLGTKWLRTDFPVQARLAACTSLPFFVETNAWAIALSERWFGAGYNNFVLIHVGEGIAAGTVIDHQLYRGGGYAGELLSVCTMPEKAATLVPGKRYKLHDVVARSKVLARLSPEKNFTKMGQVVAAARAGDQEVISVLAECAEAVAQFCVPIANLLDLEAIILSGTMFQLPALVEYIQDYLAKNTFTGLMENRSPLVTPSTFGADSGLLGAAGLVFDQVFNSHKSD